MSPPVVQILINEIFELAHMTISWSDFGFFLIIELVTRNPNLGIPALEDGLFANLLIFDDF